MKHSNTVVQLKEAWFSSIIICHQVCNKSNTTRVTCVAEPVYPSGAPEFTTGLFTLLEHQSSPPVCLPFWNTRVHTRSAYPSGTPEFTPGLFTLLEHQSSPPVFIGFRIDRYLVFCVMFCGSLSVHFLLAMYCLSYLRHLMTFGKLFLGMGPGYPN